MNIKNVVKDNVVRFESYRQGIFFYMVDVPTGEHKVTYKFPVPVDDIGEATLYSQDKAIIFMRYIRKAIEEGTFVMC